MLIQNNNIFDFCSADPKIEFFLKEVIKVLSTNLFKTCYISISLISCSVLKQNINLSIFCLVIIIK